MQSREAPLPMMLDPLFVAAVLEGFEGTLDEVVGRVENPEVNAQLDRCEARWRRFGSASRSPSDRRKRTRPLRRDDAFSPPRRTLGGLARTYFRNRCHRIDPFLDLDSDMTEPKPDFPGKSRLAGAIVNFWTPTARLLPRHRRSAFQNFGKLVRRRARPLKIVWEGLEKEVHFQCTSGQAPGELLEAGL